MFLFAIRANVNGHTVRVINLTPPIPQRLTETQLQNLVFALCNSMRLYCYHTFDSRRCAPGFPDLVIIGRRVLWRELKGWKPSSVPSRHQVEVLAGLRNAGQDAAIWKPAQWFSGQIRSELAAIRQPR
jgi:hypothetical protein